MAKPGDDYGTTTRDKEREKSFEKRTEVRETLFRRNGGDTFQTM